MRRLLSADGHSVAVRVPAKLNLFLAVRGHLPGGYHELVTVMQTVSLFDELHVGVVGPVGRGQHPAGRRRMRVQLLYDAVDGLPPPEDNLACLAAVVLGRAAGLLPGDDPIPGPGEVRSAVAVGSDGEGGRIPNDAPRTVLRLRKGIPVAAGMAGGSADAAAALVALNLVWGCDLDRDDLQALGSAIGSDVPFCVVGGTALATGRGVAIAQVLCRGTFHWVVCEADEPLATAEVYRSWDRHCRPSQVKPDATLQALRNVDARALGAALHNELEPAAFALRPELEGNKKALIEAGAVGAVLSGSGPTLLGLAADQADAERIAEEVGDRFPRVVVGRSPAGGPDLQEGASSAGGGR